jgi:DNA-binding PadR family transcriptional regulator
MGREDQPGTDPDLSVSEAEGTVLGVVARRQPVTRYQLLRAFQTSPVAGLNTSKGSLYPLVRRLVERDLVTTKPGEGTRETEVLELTTRGREALRRWVKNIGPEHFLEYDPLQFRVVSLGEIPLADRIQWIADVRQLIWQKRDELHAYRARIRLPYGQVVHSADEARLEAQLQWLDQLLVKVTREDDAERRAYYAWEGDEL